MGRIWVVEVSTIGYPEVVLTVSVPVLFDTMSDT